MHPYNSAEFINSFKGLSEVQSLEKTQTCVRLREIEGTAYQDAINLSPRFYIDDERSLQNAVNELKNRDIISATLIPDPLKPLPNADRIFDVTAPFKTHYVLDYAQDWEARGIHKSNIRYAKNKCEVKRIHFSEYLKDWQKLWDVLVERHQIKGLGKFSESHFKSLANVPGLVTYGAFDNDGNIIAMSLWFETPDYAVSHLNACTPEGYKAQANYAIYNFLIQDMKDKKSLDLGGNFGLKDNPEDGLSKFKAGFSNTTKPSFIAGVICDSQKYKELSAGKENTSFFPAYRAPKE